MKEATMNRNNASNVSSGKPKVGGAVFTAPVGTPLPTTTTEALDAAFVNLGYCSEDGVTNSTSLETQKTVAWGGDPVLTVLKSKDDQFKFKLIEVKNVDVLKYVYGDDNVSGTLETGIAINVNAKDIPERSLVIDMILRDNTAKRIVVPSAKISEFGDIAYGDGDAIGYEVTNSCAPDSEGNTHYEYLLKSGSPSA
jgi:hypothetical protein